jgi:transcriptional regulator with XRE-family HTH domain
MTARSPFAWRLKEARQRAGISQKKLGVLAGIDEFSASARINQYERGKHTPEFTTAERLARVLEVPTSYLYCREHELAEWVLTYTRLTKAERQIVIKKLRSRSRGR